MNLLQNLHLLVIEYLYRGRRAGVARSLCRHFSLDIVIVNCQ